MQQGKGISPAPPGVSRVKVGGGVGMDGAGPGGGVWGQRAIEFQVGKQESVCNVQRERP